MFGIKELKDTIKITQETVECPVIDCNTIVERQRNNFKREERFKCQKHSIYISPSTFEYQNELDNLLWKDKDDLILWNMIKTVKRETRRMSRDRSEDAVTLNVFRFLERNNMINGLLAKCLNIISSDCETIYWSYSQSQKHKWNMLAKARNEFETNPSNGSEPDLIIVSENNLIIIEAKFGSPGKDPIKLEKANKVERKYMNGGEGWWNEVFYSNFWKVVFQNEQYELSRYWLLGTWIAEILGLNFHLVSLVRSEQIKGDPAFG